MTTIQQFTVDDIPSGLKLSTTAGWNQRAEDWRRFLKLEPNGSFAAERDQQIVGTVTTCRFGNVGWIGMMLVDARLRRQGIGGKLMERALGYLESHGVRTVRLDATEFGAPLYKNMGFEVQYALRRYSGAPVVEGDRKGHDSVRPFRESDAPAALEVDQTIIGYDRRAMLEALWHDPENTCWVSEADERLSGYVFYRPGRLANCVGPCLAGDGASGVRLLNTSLACCSSEPVLVDVVVSNERAVRVVEESKLKATREFLRMSRGDQSIEKLSGLFASSGPEKG